MKPYGVNPKWDQDCCPGHSLYSRESYNSNRSKRAQTKYTKMAHKAERRVVKQKLKNIEITGD